MSSSRIIFYSVIPNGLYSMGVWVAILISVSLVQHWFAWITDTKSKSNIIIQWMITNIPHLNVLGKDESFSFAVFIGLVVFLFAPGTMVVLTNYWYPVLIVSAIILLCIGVSWLTRLVLRLRKTVNNHITDGEIHPWTRET